jgi:hypothetical protein
MTTAYQALQARRTENKAVRAWDHGPRHVEAGRSERGSAERHARMGIRAAQRRGDRIQKLADLHDRGALSDAEFAAEKAKLLNEG